MRSGDKVPMVLVLQSMAAWAGAEYVRGVFKFAKLHGPWSVQLVAGVPGEPVPQTVRGLSAYDGIIAGSRAADYADILEKTDRHVVLMDVLPQFAGSGVFRAMPRVCGDSVMIGRMAADYFLKAGCENFAYIGDFGDMGWSRIRGEAFAFELGKHGRSCAMCDVSSSHGLMKSNGLIRKWLEGLPRPVAIMAAQDGLARQVAGICRYAGLEIPKDVAVMGFGDAELICNGSVPTISSIRRDWQAVGYAAAELLDALMCGRKIREARVVIGPSGIVERESTDFASLREHPLVRQIRNAIRRCAQTGMEIPKLLRPMKVSRRYAEIKFREATGMSILEAIHNERMRLVEGYLKDTDVPLGRIAELCGFRSESAMRDLFLKRHGINMRDFRNAVR